MATPILSKPSGRGTWAWWQWVFLAILCVLPATGAGDTSFGGDEATLLSKATLANAMGVWADVGLVGTVGRRYGPLPTWIYQIGLSITSDAVVLCQMRAALVTAITLASAAWIARLLRFGFGWVLIISASPYLTYYSRNLWDNSFNIPLAALATALLLHLTIRRRLWPLPLLVAALGSMLLVHPMSLPLVVGAGAILLIFGWPAVAAVEVREQAIAVVGTLLIVFFGWFATAGYRHAILNGRRYASTLSIQHDGWWFAFFSPRLVSAIGIDYLLPAGYLQASPGYALLVAAQWVSGGVFVLAWAGIVLSVYAIAHRRGTLAVAGAFAVIVIAGQLLLNGLTHTFGHPHYYNATWIAPAILIGITLNWLGGRRPLLPNVVCGILFGCLAFSTLYFTIRIHGTGGGRYGQVEVNGRFGGYGPTMANQQAVARADHARGPAAKLHIFGSTVFPESLRALYLLEEKGPPVSGPPASFNIEYLHPSNIWDGRIALTRASPDQ